MKNKKTFFIIALVFVLLIGGAISARTRSARLTAVIFLKTLCVDSRSLSEKKQERTLPAATLFT